MRLYLSPFGLGHQPQWTCRADPPKSAGFDHCGCELLAGSAVWLTKNQLDHFTLLLLKSTSTVVAELSEQITSQRSACCSALGDHVPGLRIMATGIFIFAQFKSVQC
jgi:hypothetical protein